MIADATTARPWLSIDSASAPSVVDDGNLVIG